MKRLRVLLSAITLLSLFACTDLSITEKSVPKTAPQKSGYLDDNISQKTLDNPAEYKKYHYLCRNVANQTAIPLITYFPLSRESRKKENFGIYFQLAGQKAEPFDHIENKPLNARGTRFEVIYRSYRPIQGSYIELIAHQNSSTYYKNRQGVKKTWLKCREA